MNPNTKKGDPLTCEACGETYLAGWDMEEAIKEYLERFGKEPNFEDDALVCDDCHKKLDELMAGELGEAYRAKMN